MVFIGIRVQSKAGTEAYLTVTTPAVNVSTPSPLPRQQRGLEMSTPSRHKCWQIFSVAFVCASAAICGTDSGVALAWYGPPALPASATPPGGFSDIITSQTIDPSGG